MGPSVTKFYLYVMALYIWCVTFLWVTFHWISLKYDYCRSRSFKLYISRRHILSICHKVPQNFTFIIHPLIFWHYHLFLCNHWGKKNPLSLPAAVRKLCTERALIRLSYTYLWKEMLKKMRISPYFNISGKLMWSFAHKQNWIIWINKFLKYKVTNLGTFQSVLFLFIRIRQNFKMPHRCQNTLMLKTFSTYFTAAKSSNFHYRLWQCNDLCVTVSDKLR